MYCAQGNGYNDSGYGACTSWTQVHVQDMVVLRIFTFLQIPIVQHEVDTLPQFRQQNSTESKAEFYCYFHCILFFKTGRFFGTTASDCPNDMTLVQ